MKYAIYKGSLRQFDEDTGKFVALAGNEVEVLEFIKNNAHPRNKVNGEFTMHRVKELVNGCLDSLEHNFYLWAKETA